MHFFDYKNDKLFCDGVCVADIATEVGTPFYLYSYAALQRHYTVFDAAFASVPHIVCYAVKANSNIAVLKTLASFGAGADIVSGGELFRTLSAGVPPEKIVYSGVGKRVDEIEAAIRAGILMFNIESAQELEVVNEVAARLKTKVGIALRVNPDVNPETHPKISTGLKENKFGTDVKTSLSEYKKAKILKHVDIIGISCHIGSQLTKIEPFIDALARIKKLLLLLKKEGISIRYLDLGGGLGIRYNAEELPLPEVYAAAIIKRLSGVKATLILEPGRVLVGNAGILVAKVLYTKENSGKNFVVVDAGMNDLIRPSFYDSYHHIQPLQKSNRSQIVADVVGPICETGDFLAKERKLATVERGELLAVMSAGAYGFTMSSNYNSRGRVAEVLVRGSKFYLIRKREAHKELTRLEKIPNFLYK